MGGVHEAKAVFSFPIRDVVQVRFSTDGGDRSGRKVDLNAELQYAQLSPCEVSKGGHPRIPTFPVLLVKVALCLQVGEECSETSKLTFSCAHTSELRAIFKDLAIPLTHFWIKDAKSEIDSSGNMATCVMQELVQKLVTCRRMTKESDDFKVLPKLSYPVICQ